MRADNFAIYCVNPRYTVDENIHILDPATVISPLSSLFDSSACFRPIQTLISLRLRQVLIRIFFNFRVNRSSLGEWDSRRNQSCMSSMSMYIECSKKY